MQEVFEKIIEKLEERTSFLSDCTKYGNKDAEQQNKSYSTMMMYEVSDLVDDLIEIVKQEAEKYNNGWIPCSERLPEEYEDVEVTVEEIADDVGGKRYYNVRSWLQDGQWVIKKNPYKPTVIAWKYPTEPYQPKGE